MQSPAFNAYELHQSAPRRRLSTSHRIRLVGALMPVAGLLGLAVAHASAPTVHYPGTQGWAPVYDGIPMGNPVLNHVIAKLSNGTTVAINCTALGKTATSWYRAKQTRWWDGITVDGREGYIADAWVDTNTMARANATTCSQPGGDLVGGGGSGGGAGLAMTWRAVPMDPRASLAVSRAWAQVGSTEWRQRCEAMVASDYQRPSWPSAIDQWNGARAVRHYGDWNPPAGALLFFAANGTNGGFGHVAIATGQGSDMITNYRNNPVIKATIGWEAYPNAAASWPGAAYLGWIDGSDAGAWPA